MSISPPSPPEGNEFRTIGALEMVLLRNDFYKDIYHKLMLVCLGLVFLLSILLFFLDFECDADPPPHYFATTNEGFILPLVDLGLPHLSTNYLLNWAMEASIAAYNMNFVNYRHSIQNSRRYFTHKGYLNFITALKESNNLNAIKQKKMVVYGRINGTPTVSNDSNQDPTLSVGGAFTWEVQIPIVITYENSNPEDKIEQNSIITMLVTRLSPLEAPAGVGINSFIIRAA